MTIAVPDPTVKTAYKAGALALLLAAASILGALAFEHIGGLPPCPLCLEQRYAYYAGIPVLFFALVVLSAGEARWADALPLFERAYALSSEPSALYNVAATLRALGRYADTVDALEKLEADHSDLSDALRADVHEMLVEARGRVARLIVSHTLGEVPVVFRIDSRPLPLDPWPTQLRADAGPHVVDAETEGHLPFRWESTLSEGESQHLAIEFVADAPDVVVVERPRRGWIAAVVVGLVVIGTGVALGVALSGGNDPVQHRTGTVVVDL